MIKIFTLFMMVSFIPTAYAADKEDNQQMQYNVYAGGIHALQANLNVNMPADDPYDLRLQAKTYGILGKLAPWQGIFETAGVKMDDVYRPKEHKATTIWKDEEEVKTYTYNKDGSFKNYRLKDEKNIGSVRDVDDALTQGTNDVLSATLNVMQSVALNNKCEGSTEIFDGKRRFNLIFKEKRQVDLTASRYNVYEGPALECTAEVEPIAGKWREKPRGWMSIQEQGRERGTMPTVWFAQLDEGQAAVPVKVRVKTKYGTLFMHLTNYETAGKSLSLKD